MVSSYSYAYSEPSLSYLLTVSSFLVLLNLFRISVEYVVSGAGLLGEILVGVIFGTPLAGILTDEWMATFDILGYVGLCLMVLEGGLNTPLSHALPALPLSLVIACTGILAPIASSLIYFKLVLRPRYSLLHAFAAGAALSSTSLGTTFSVLSSVGGEIGQQIGQSRLGAVLMSAAMADDVVGLILLQVVVVVSSTSSSSIGWTVGRPLLASGGMLAVSWIIARWLLKPIVSFILRGTPERLRHEMNMSIIVVLATGYVAIASLAGTSPLLGAFVAGIVLAFLSGPHMSSNTATASAPTSLPTFRDTLERYVAPTLSYLLRPIFFASIGFAIPVKIMFNGSVVWKGIIYAIIMTGAKLLCAIWVPIADNLSSWWATRERSHTAKIDTPTGRQDGSNAQTRGNLVDNREQPSQKGTKDVEISEERRATSVHSPTDTAVTPPTPPASPPPQVRRNTADATVAVRKDTLQRTPSTNSDDNSRTPPPALQSTTYPPIHHVSADGPLRSSSPTSLLLPTSLLGLAMVARGGIGLLIAQVARTAGLLEDELFLICIWATVLCTIIGPVGVGWVCRRWERIGAGLGRWR